MNDPTGLSDPISFCRQILKKMYWVQPSMHDIQSAENEERKRTNSEDSLEQKHCIQDQRHQQEDILALAFSQIVAFSNASYKGFFFMYYNIQSPAPGSNRLNDEQSSVFATAGRFTQCDFSSFVT
jgi:hypothetical protein